MPDTHVHMWGPIQHSRFAGTPSRPCTDYDCNVVSLDLYLYCAACNAPLTIGKHGKYHHIDPDTNERLRDWDDHEIVPETGEAPYDDEDEDA